MVEIQSGYSAYKECSSHCPYGATAVIVGNFLGAFDLLEWEVRDTFFRQRPAEASDQTIVVVTIDELDIQAAKDWPIPDGILAEA
ncbi:MAG: hypothetical protein DCF25_15685 [Leptolyngbya foveolarum]|uniref:CHASE2 domain-containing protein n=1 Tax=Leptolyngbya foveolarum TaxID=47253 RepID=A0A2W4W3X1_9CYAN|nr:MAG: hypothetical protein DCF25_15685 [Leptolyngbya foveolarum]